MNTRSQKASYIEGESSRNLHRVQGDTKCRTLEQDLRGEQQQRLATAYSKLHEYSTTSYPSRPASPGSVEAHQRYLQDLGSTEIPAYDTLIVNVFVGLFQVHVAPTFPCFQNFRIGAWTPEEVYLAMAAVGGLFCHNSKSEIVAKWLLHVARRKLLTVVS